MAGKKQKNSIVSPTSSAGLQLKNCRTKTVVAMVVITLTALICFAIVDKQKNKLYSRSHDLYSQINKFKDCHVAPEYCRSLKKVVLSLGTINSTLSLQDDFGYKQPGTSWAQDMFEVMQKDDGQLMLLTPEVHKYYTRYKSGKRSRLLADNAYLNEISFANADVVRSPLVSQGGNILVDKIDGKTIVFCGGDTLTQTRSVWKAIAGKELTDSNIRDLLTLTFNADKVVIAGIDNGVRLQPRLLYHLDQAMILLGDKVVGLTCIVDELSSKTTSSNDVKIVLQFLDKLKTVLLDLGYKVIDIDMTVDNLLNYQHYLNSIAYC